MYITRDNLDLQNPVIVGSSALWFSYASTSLKTAVANKPANNHSIISSLPSSTLATCETSQVLLAGVPGGFSRGVSPVFAHLLIGPYHMSYLERDIKLNLKKIFIDFY